MQKSFPVAPLSWAAVASAFAWWGVRYGPAFGPDSVSYAGVGHAPFALFPDLFNWPPGFWALIQVFRLGPWGLWTAVGAALISSRALLAAGAFHLGCKLGGRAGGHGLAAFTFLWCPLVTHGLACLSETLFLGLMLYWYAAVVGTGEPGSAGVRAHWRATMWAAAMVTTRFLGLPLAGVGWLIGVGMLRRGRAPRPLRTGLLSGVAIIAPVVAWGLLGRLLFDAGVGVRNPAPDSLAVHLQRLGYAWWEPFYTGRATSSLWGLGQILVLPRPVQNVLFVSGLVLFWTAVQPPARGGRPWRLGLVAAGGVYVTTLVAVNTVVWLEPIGTRFLLPAVLAVAANVVSVLRDARWNGWFIVGAGVPVAIWIIEGSLAHQLEPRFSTTLGAGMAIASAAAAWVGVWRTPTSARRSVRRMATGLVWAAVACVCCAHAAWTVQALARVRRGDNPTVLHAGWRGRHTVRTLVSALAPGDSVFAHPAGLVGMLLADEPGVRVEPLLVSEVQRAEAPPLDAVLTRLDADPSAGTTWIVVCPRLLLLPSQVTAVETVLRRYPAYVPLPGAREDFYAWRHTVLPLSGSSNLPP